jgi:(p)ppGpp synthase/HD superfamily hydrolase
MKSNTAVVDTLTFVIDAFGASKGGSEPFAFQHSVRVGMKGMTVAEIVVGLLHDIVEDTQVTVEDIRQYDFSLVDDVIVGDAVDLLTHQERHTYIEYIDSLLSGAGTNRATHRTALYVKMHDLEDNLGRIDDYDVPETTKDRLVERWAEAQRRVCTALGIY